MTPKEQLEKINSMVGRFFSRTVDGIDREGLAVDIWMESWKKNQPLSWIFIRSRCLDAIRKATRKRETPLEYAPNLESDESEEKIDKKDFVSYLMSCKDLSN